MKKHYLITFIAVLLTLFTACSNDKLEPTIMVAIKKLKAEPLSGAIKLTWSKPLDESYTTLRIKYTNENCDKSSTIETDIAANEFVVEGLQNKDGAYQFELHPIHTSGELGRVSRISATAKKSAQEEEESQAFFDYILTTDNTSTNAQSPDEGPLANLFDGDTKTYFHTDWRDSGADLWPHWIEIEISDNIQAKAKFFQFEYITRDNNYYGNPTEIKVQVSNDGTNFVTLETLTEEKNKLPGKEKTKATYISDIFELERAGVDKMTHLRLTVTKNVRETSTYFALSELDLRLSAIRPN